MPSSRKKLTGIIIKWQKSHRYIFTRNYLMTKTIAGVFSCFPTNIWPFLKVDERLNYLSQTFLKIIVIYFDINGNLMLGLLCLDFMALCFHCLIYLLKQWEQKYAHIHDYFIAWGKITDFIYKLFQLYTRKTW